MVDTVRAALDRAASAASAPAGAADRNGEGAAGAGAGEGDGAAAEALALELAGDERLMESVCEDAALRQQLAGLLWNHAHGCLGRQAFEAALAFFSAALLLLEPGSPCQDAEEGGGGKGGATPTPAEGYRAMACAALAAGQTDRWACCFRRCSRQAAHAALQPTSFLTPC